MIKFFRRIRQKLLSENKFSKYLIYAVGEIVLVVIGILIALWLNNLNTQYKQKQEEVSILKELKEDFLLDITDFEINVEGHSKSNVSIAIILKSLEDNLPYNDSLAHHFAWTTNWPISLIHTNSFDVLKSKGIELISNDELRKKILTIHGQSYQSLKAWENQPNRNFYLEEILKRFNKLDAWNVNNNGKFIQSEIIPNNYESLKTDVLYKSILNSIKSDNQRVLNAVYVKVIKKLKALIVDIDNEIDTLSKS
ncbi:DUF6090 family protein [Winogradskyella flava]|uniref:DUF6090 family protein n=1 Tax=Winogradskyella flava TaxID=1884876 RepID=UPI0024900E18|nr:DUF6090 family protein [Winogradskyella flava]